MENTVLQLIKVIMALYFNDKADDNNTLVFDEVGTILQEIKVDPRAGTGIGGEDGIIDALRHTAEWMVYNREGGYIKEDVVQRIAINTHGNSEYLTIVKESLPDSIEPVYARNRSNSIMKELRFEKRHQKIKSTISKANAVVNFSGEHVEMGTFVNNLMTELNELHSSGSGDIPGLVGKVNFNDPIELEAALKKGTELVKEDGLLNTGLIGLNKACGGIGIKRGAMVNFGGLTHNYKSGMLKDLALNLPHMNDPWMWDASKKPLILRVSFENTIDEDIIDLYKKLYEIKYQKRCDLPSIDINIAVKELNDHMHIRGYEFQTEHYDPSSFSIYDLFDLINKYIEAGYEIHGFIIDYLPLIASNTFGDRKDEKIQRTYEMVRNFCYPKGITVFTGCQLSTEAQNEARINTATFTRKVCTGGWYMDCKSLHTKLDLEFVMHIHHHIDGYSYLMISRGKHRGGESTPHSHRHFMYKFEEHGGIVPDFDQESRALYQLPQVSDTGAEINWDD